MATLLCTVLSSSSDVVRMSCAGHPPPILADPHRVAVTLPLPVDLPVGVALGRPRRGTDVVWGSGSVLCLYSDGLVERRGVVIDDSIETLRTTVTAQTPEAVCVAVMQRLVGSAEPEDDVAVLVMRRLGVSTISCS